jgi:prephenate dehydrogenase
MTRLARGDPAMGAGILATNAGEVMTRLRELQAVLAEWSSELEAADAEGLEKRLAGARAALADGDA